MIQMEIVPAMDENDSHPHGDDIMTKLIDKTLQHPAQGVRLALGAAVNLGGLIVLLHGLPY